MDSGLYQALPVIPASHLRTRIFLVRAVKLYGILGWRPIEVWRSLKAIPGYPRSTSLSQIRMALSLVLEVGGYYLRAGLAKLRET